ncbi:MAG: pyridoxal phosphate-dependent aminotransferase [Anaerolineaceae bacterium]|jgi:cystathionine beta-lyase|nr:MAG: pyridoxal phosphate-dependent aminotransferase [Anaerolineaceae bacterium]
MTNFNAVPDRRKNINLTKWTAFPKDVLPMWVADMDFPAPKPVLNALHKRLDHGVFGYEMPGRVLQETVSARMERLYGWKVNPESVLTIPGIVSGFNVAARVFCSPRKGMAIQTPVYNEFHEVKNNAGISQINIPLVKSIKKNILHYEIDWDLFERRVKKAGIFLLCNPHNPLGIIFPRKDLARMAEICIKHKALIVSDEIHSELLLDGNKFAPMAKISREVEKHTITLIAPSKTFNIPGLFCGFAIIPNKELREPFEKEMRNLRLHVASMGLHAANAAFSGKCDGWLRELLAHLTDNRDFLVEYVTKYMPGVRTTKPDATYLGWLDFTQSGLEEPPFEFFKEKARVALSDGKIFGKEGEGHLRINFGTTRSLLQEGLERMKNALDAFYF